ncbi:MAG: hypothetical protein RMJ38_06965 [candidate division WOR-3 bacterium]|nr:hypothetical protein [candidate division WOR-3 bacterium]MDW8151162.1 hypothetical protein [candidate division WOR-3 bacterium]
MIVFLVLEIGIKEINGAKLDKNTSMCRSEFKGIQNLILTPSNIEQVSLLDVKVFKVQNLALLMKDLKYKLSLLGYIFVASYKHNYFFVDPVSKAKSVYNKYNFYYFSKYIVAKLVKEKNLCIYEIEIK